MTYTFKLSRRIARLRGPMIAALLLTMVGCNSTDSFNPDNSTSPGLADTGLPQFATAFAGGIPIGTFGQPNSAYGAQFNGAVRIISPTYLLSNLAEIKSRGGKVLLDLAGNQALWRDAAGHFSMSLWKARIDRFKSVNFSSYINDGTIIGHYLIDEPDDPANWSGTLVPPSVVEEMAKYSKQLWPNMATVVRAEAAYMGKSGDIFRYLDATWAQYTSWRRGTIDDYLRRNVADAQRLGLALIVGLNITKGYDQSELTPTQARTWGASMMNSSYPCAFLSWKYSSDLLSGAMKDAMSALRTLAQSKTSKSCRNSSSAPAPTPAPSPSPSPSPVPVTSQSLPFGLFHTPIEEYSTEWSGTVYHADPAYLMDRLVQAQGAKMKMIIRLAGAQSKNADGTFSLTKWKAQVDRYRSLALGTYISGRTFYVHELVDQPSCASCWGGKAIPWGTVEEMARYSKSIWPSLPTAAWVAPSKLAAATFRWNYLDAGWIQYNTSMGDLRTYLAAELNRAGQEGLGLVVGLNLQHAAGADTGPMTASQIKTFGTILASSSVCALTAYRHDPTYLGQTGIRQALDSVASVARRRNAGPCVVS